jgi:hypothetical protein
MNAGQVEKYTDEVKRLIEQRLRIKSATLDKALSRVGRLLPTWAQREGRYLTQATQVMAHPKLRLMVDEAKVEKAHKTLVEHLKTIHPVERRKTRVLGTLGVVSFNLIVVVVALVSFLIWRGYL